MLIAKNIIWSNFGELNPYATYERLLMLLENLSGSKRGVEACSEVVWLTYVYLIDLLFLLEQPIVSLIDTVEHASVKSGVASSRLRRVSVLKWILRSDLLISVQLLLRLRWV